MSEKITTPGQVADIIERFLSDSSLYPQEFNDFIDCGLSDSQLDAYRERCEMLHSDFESRLAERDLQREASATKELEQIVVELRLLERNAQNSSEETAR